MQWADNHHQAVAPGKRLRSLRWCRGSAAILFMGGVLAAAQQGQQPSTGATPAQDPGPSRPAAGATPLAVPAAQNATQNFNAANAERRKQISEDSAKLLALATDLKAEVDKTNQDTLSLAVVRKAEEIEKLAHAVKEMMKQTAGIN